MSCAAVVGLRLAWLTGLTGGAAGDRTGSADAAGAAETAGAANHPGRGTVSAVSAVAAVSTGCESAAVHRCGVAACAAGAAFTAVSEGEARG